MTTKGVADIVFCLDASHSMRPCFEGVRKHVTDFIGGLDSNPQLQWDWRIDFLAHAAEGRGDGLIFTCSSTHHTPENLFDALYLQHSARFFTTDTAQFCQGLSRVNLAGDEAPLVALDCCLDYPWRESDACHRVVIMMTDEAFETGAARDFQSQQVNELINKIQDLRVMLFLVAPDSALYDQLSAVEKSEYKVVQAGGGLASVDFREVMLEIGKSISVSQSQQSAPKPVRRGLYNQAEWVTQKHAFGGDR